MTELLVPLLLTFISLYALIRKQDVYALLLSGAREGLSTLLSIAPSLIVLLTGISMLLWRRLSPRKDRCRHAGQHRDDVLYHQRLFWLRRHPRHAPYGFCRAACRFYGLFHGVPYNEVLFDLNRRFRTVLLEHALL